MTREEKLKIFKEKGWSYDPETGEIISHTGKIIKGKSYGYISCGLTINKQTHSIRGHILAWYLYYNEVANVIDHINRDKSDNRISNLRSVSHQENLFNNSAKGFYYNKRDKRYMSYIKLNNKQIYIGYFKTEKEARQAYLDAKKIYHKIN